MPELIRVLGCDNPRRRGDVVFIHGLNGDPRDYWGKPGGHWPLWLGEALPDVGVWSFGYENAAFRRRKFSFLSRGFAMPLADRATSALLTSEVHGLGKKPLVFITHSMGGLLVKQVLRAANDALPESFERGLLANTKGVCFIATPHIGADLAKWVTYFRALLGTNVSVDELRPHEPLLRDLKKWYSGFVTRPDIDIKTLSFHEMKPMSMVGLVVDPGDADPGIPHSGCYPLDENHRTICQPQSRQADIHLKTVAFVEDCLPFDKAHRDATPNESRWEEQPFDLSHVWNVPYPRNDFFTGRDQVIVDLRKSLSKRRRALLTQAISGLGGIGKTQTAVAYAYRYRDKYKAVLWLNAESSLSLKIGYADIARRLQLPFPENDLDKAVPAFKQWLRTEPEWLLIFDNADDPGLLPPFLPEAEHGHILLTSRAQDFQNLGIVNPIGLEELSLEDATAFLLHRCGRQDADAPERDAATQLAREMHGLPLSLEQAASYINESKTTFQRYHESYRARGLKLVDERLPALGKYARSVTTTWAVNFEAVARESPAAAEVLRFGAFLDPDAVPFELLTRGAPELGPLVSDALASSDGDPLRVNDLLRPLARFSLIRVDGTKETWGTHRMVQEVLRHRMDDAQRCLWAERAVRAMDRAFPAVEHAHWPLCKRLLPHALAVARGIPPDRMRFEEAGRLLNQVALYLNETGQYAEAEPLLKESLEIYRIALGEGHPDYATALNNLAELYQAMGRHAEAEPLYRESLEIYRDALGEGHPDYATALNNLAMLYDAMGRHAEAEPLYRESLEIRRDALGEGHPDYASSLNNLASLYYAMGRHAEAEPLYLASLEISRVALGEGHPSYATALNNLAMLYDAMGRHAEAEPLYRESLEIRRDALGEGHPDYASSLNNLASLYYAMGRHAEAEPLLRASLEILRVALGEGHPSYATAPNNLAALYNTMGRHAEAEPLLNQSRETGRQRFPLANEGLLP